MTVQSPENKNKNDWQKVQSKKGRRRQEKEQPPKQPSNKPRPEPKRKKPRKRTRPDALIIRPAEKTKYADILRRIKQDVPDEQVRTAVEKIYRTNSGDMLITLTRKSSGKGHALRESIAGILKEDAKVICSGPQETLEIRDIDDDTSNKDIQAALWKTAGETCEIPLEAIKIRKAYRGTQMASHSTCDHGTEIT